ncbi:MAG: ferrous iron transport protein B [Endomicrobia bacterium]|nr:ferrous iron transport protein B [Endomicrobiia bacterium]MCL2506197.1 ferrous iron transport protein B [Endomicrobiia bacterium]
MVQNRKIIVALAGNPNCGKSTIFNTLTGANQRVGNYPGVTVEKKEGFREYKGCDITFVDLPGTYSLSAYSEDEVVAGDFLLNEKPDIVIHVVDASNMERNLYLFTQLAELDIPLIVALNMIDILQAQGKSADEKVMSDLLGVPVFATVGNKKIGLEKILDYIVENEDFSRHKAKRTDYGSDIKAETDELEPLISKDEALKELPKNWLLIKLLDNDPLALKLAADADNSSEILAQIEKSRNHLKEHFGDKVEIIITGRRYGFANAVAKTVLKDVSGKKTDITEIIDSFALNKYLGIPVFAAVMYIIFKFTFSLSGPVVHLFGLFFEKLGGFTGNLLPDGPVKSLIVDGIIGGVGGVLSFFPLILFMFFAIAFFEDSGYMARAAFVMDKIMSRFGLHGKSFLPLMISTNGCAVPGILATRTLDSKRDRLITMFVTPFMICGAKLPVFALIIGAFFSAKYQTGVMFSMYILSVVIALGAAKLLSKTVLRGEPAHFVMELPPYHLPTLKGLLLKMWERGWLYVKKAGTIIVLASIIIWAMFSYPKAPANENFTEAENASIQIQYSVAGRIGSFIEPLFKPIGMDGNRAVALVAGFAAKEIVVSTLGTIYSLGEVNPEDSQPLREKIAADPDWSPLKGIVFLIFCLIYIPCIASVVVFFKESGSSIKWLTLLVAGTTGFAWIVSFIVFQIGTLLGL